MQTLDYALRKLALALIRFYQATISFDHGLLRFLYPNGYCKFHPTCSEYAAQAISKHGTVKGPYLAMRRLLRCHPFSKGGLDPVP